LSETKKVKIKQFDCPEYYKDEMKSSFSFINALIIEIAFLFTLLMNVGNMVLEKQTKMKVKEILRNLYSLNIKKSILFKGLFGHRRHQMVRFMVDQYAPLFLSLLHSQHFDHSDWYDRIETAHY